MSNLASRWIPTEHLNSLRQGHASGCDVLLGTGVRECDIEPVGVAEWVEAHRWAWKPKRVRLVLLAESHVHTQQQELAFDYAGSRYFPSDIDAPTRFVRLIYCLAYGEKLLARDFNGGTPQFWAIFGALAGTNPRHRRGAGVAARLSEKVRTLQILAERGVWLLDASLHAVALRKGVRLPPKVTQILQRLWWDDYGRAIIAETHPERVVAIGKGLHGSMSGYVQFDAWIYQPQGARNGEQRRWNDDALTDLRVWLEV